MNSEEGFWIVELLLQIVAVTNDFHYAKTPLKHLYEGASSEWHNMARPLDSYVLVFVQRKQPTVPVISILVFYNPQMP